MYTAGSPMVSLFVLKCMGCCGTHFTVSFDLSLFVYAAILVVIGNVFMCWLVHVIGIFISRCACPGNCYKRLWCTVVLYLIAS